jgi:hypothetical protein
MDTGRQPHPNARRDRDHRRTSARNAAFTNAGSTRPGDPDPPAPRQFDLDQADGCRALYL